MKFFFETTLDSDTKISEPWFGPVAIPRTDWPHVPYTNFRSVANVIKTIRILCLSSQKNER